MNLVAKEYVAAQDPADPGVLVLSRFAGAAAQLDSALLVNPHDAEGMAEIDRRRARHAAGRAADALAGRLGGDRRHLAGGLGAGFPARLGAGGAGPDAHGGDGLKPWGPPCRDGLGDLPDPGPAHHG